MTVQIDQIPKGIQAIIFDMDGLMLDTERLSQRAWQQAGSEWHYDFSSDDYLEAVGRTMQGTEIVFRKNYGEDFPFETMYKRKQQYLQEIIDTEGIPTKSGLFELLDWIDQSRLAKAVATSTARPLAIKKLTMTDLVERFEIVVCGNEIPNGKPAPDIFLKAPERLQISPAHCIVLEDSEAGIRAAHAAGMWPIWVPDLKPSVPEVAELTYKVMSDLHEVRHTLALL